VEGSQADAVAFLAERTLSIKKDQLGTLKAPPNFVSVTLETPPGDPTPTAFFRKSVTVSE
jgi:hypothetical protein